MNTKTIWQLMLMTALALVLNLAGAAGKIDPRLQPVGTAAPYTLTKPGLADGNAKVFRPYFDDKTWWGSVEAYAVDTSGNIAATPLWQSHARLDATPFASRKIYTCCDGAGNAVAFDQISKLSSTYQNALNNSQALMDFIRGDRSQEGTTYRTRTSVMGDVVHSNIVYADYDGNPLDQTGDLVFVGANDGMLHAFHADSGDEAFAYIPRAVTDHLKDLADPAYVDSHRYYVDGQLTQAAGVTFSDGTKHRVLVGTLGGGGQGIFALDITNTTPSASSLMLWDHTDGDSGLANLGFTYSRPVITQVVLAGGPRWVVIVGNGYANDFADGTVGNSQASLMVFDLETGALLREIGTGAGTAASPNGLSSPTAVDSNGIAATAELVYAGDLDGNLWRFDISDPDPANWKVALGGKPLFQARDQFGTPQAITIAPRVLSHPDGGNLVLIGTGRILSWSDVSLGNSVVNDLYGLHDRLNGTVIDPAKLVAQQFTESLYPPGGSGTQRVRTSSNLPVPANKDGWLVDLPAGEQVVSDLRIRSGRVIATSYNPTLSTPEVWVNEVNFLTGGAPADIIYDMNGDGVLDTKDNVDGNRDGDLFDAVDHITGIFQGSGVVVSSPTLAVLSATRGTFLVNRVDHALAPPVPTSTPTDPGLLGGHFDVDTTQLLSTALPQGSASTDGHVHQYDDKFNVKGVDYFGLLDPKLHNINVDITNPNQKFKLIIVNAHRSPGGRLVINQAYSETNSATYTPVTSYAAQSLASLPVFTLGTPPDANTQQLTKLGIYFDVNAILNKQLVPTQTGCVRSNTPSTFGEWRNGALTIWAVKVNPDGSDAFTLQYGTDAAGNTIVTGIQSGLLWESTLFWHWKGPCTNEYGTLNDAYTYTDANGNTVTTTVWDYWMNQTLLAAQKNIKKKKNKKKRKSKGKDKGQDKDRKKDCEKGKGGCTTTTTPPPGPVGPAGTISPPASLSNPNRASWSEVF